MLTRKMLKAMEIEDGKIDQIIEAHTETTDSLKADRDKYKDELEALKESTKGDADALKAVQKELEDSKKAAEENKSYKEKYDAEHKAFDEFKGKVEAEKVKGNKTTAYKALLKEAGVSDKRIDSIVKVTAIDEIELDDEGKIKDAEKTVENIKSEWAEFIETKSSTGASTGNPPVNNGGGKMTKEEILAIKDRNERQQAISENHELFGY